MTEKIKLLLVLDSYKYRQHQEKLKDRIANLCNPYFYYTDYENGLVRFFHGIPRIGNFFSHISYWTISFFAAFHIIIFYRRKYSQKVFINPIVCFFYCFLDSIFYDKEKIYLMGFLFVPKTNKFYFKLRKRLVNIALKKATHVIVYSRIEVDLYSEWFPKHATKFKFVKYGRDYDIFEENQYESEKEYIASGGVSNRDFNILARALFILIAKYPDLACKIATRLNRFPLKCKPANMEFLYNIRIGTFGSFLEKSIFVIIPLMNNSISAGHMTLLESMYRGKIVLIADIPSVRDYVDEELVFFYKPGDPEDLADKIGYIYQNINNFDFQSKSVQIRKVYQANYNFSSFLERIIKEVTGAIIDQL